MPKRKSEIAIWIKNNETNELRQKKRGPNPKGIWVRGYKDQTGTFVEGTPPIAPKGKPGRPRKIATASSRTIRKSISIPSGSGMSGEIEKIVQRELEKRLKMAKAAAIDAFTRALEI
ncbi:MAG: hypothetical protein V1899_07025 [Planctomycetota bacterium]